MKQIVRRETEPPKMSERSASQTSFLLLYQGIHANEDWLRGLDSNQDNQLQRLACYQLHYPGVVGIQNYK